MSKSTVKGGSTGKWFEYFHEMAGLVCAIAIVLQKRKVSTILPAADVMRILFIVKLYLFDFICCDC